MAAQQEVRAGLPICPTPDDPDTCNVYNELAFPEEIYESINEFYEEQAAGS